MGNSRVFEEYGPKIVEGMFKPGVRIEICHKDLGIVIDMASRLNNPLPLTSLACQVFASAKALGLSDADHAAVVKVYEKISGVRISKGE